MLPRRRSVFRNFLSFLRKDCNIGKLVKNGLIIGENCSIARSCVIDESHTWLIEIGNNVTITERCVILAHDASMRKDLGYTKLGNVKVGDNVFVGVNSVILPNTTIGDGAIIGAGSVVSGNVEANSVYAGVPARKIATKDEFLSKHKGNLTEENIFDDSYTLRGNVSDDKKAEMKERISRSGVGYVK